ncbi:hypothetical protein ACFQY5_10915 [Paeniroseomonas aquatica]|uniref:Uncharacterized protein n=1 Tax=Paeniroseomonas aquatica TaxID=373043 RepID=A0ABT8A7M0_9PROT|nr:hypothetical protein [Paeniroseomonas aquatica]MDN3565809.1 hypothetical protein [Paeniroseomonas aquatica]
MAPGIAIAAVRRLRPDAIGMSELRAFIPQGQSRLPEEAEA